jgi:hypothetical protein
MSYPSYPEWMTTPAKRLATENLTDVTGAKDGAAERLNDMEHYEVLRHVQYWPAEAPGHTHSLMYIRYHGPLSLIAERMQQALFNLTGQIHDVVEVAEAMLIKAGEEEPLRRAIVDLCQPSASFITLVERLNLAQMDYHWEQEEKSLHAEGAFVFTNDPPQTLPGWDVKGGEA